MKARSLRSVAQLALASSLASCLGLALLATPLQAGHDHVHPPAATPNPAERVEAATITLDSIPNTPLIDQHGHARRFNSDFVDGGVVAINFIFTSCTTVCSPMGAIFARLQQEIASRPGAPVRFVSLTVDPVTDTPERLAAWAARFRGSPDWALLTGEKHEVDDLLKQLGVFTALKEEHAPIMLIGNAATGKWTRAYGLAPVERLAELIDELRAPAATPLSLESGARDYFTDTVLIDQLGREQRFYSDLIQGKTVVINSFFGECEDSCPVTHATMMRIQEMLGERLGKDVHLLSISVDPSNDTPSALSQYARRFQAKPGWFFLTGAQQQVDRALYKLGLATQARESHKSILLVGNDRTGLWKKVFALAPAAEVLAIVRSVVDDSH